MEWHIADVETTSLSPEDGEIAELAVLTCSGTEIVDIFHQFYSVKSISAKASEVNGFTVEQLQGWPSFKSKENIETLQKLFKYKIFAHNATFDGRFLCHNKVISGLHPMKDTLTFCRNDGIKLENNKLGTWAKHYGIYTEAHSALQDVFMLYKLILIKGWQIR